MSWLDRVTDDELMELGLNLDDPLGKFVEVGTMDGPEDTNDYESVGCTARSYRMDSRAVPSSGAELDAFNRMVGSYECSA